VLPGGRPEDVRRPGPQLSHGLAAHLVDREPALDQRRIRLGVEEQPPGVPVAEALALRTRGAREQLGPARKGVHVAVPVEDDRPRSQPAHDRIVRMRHPDRLEPDLGSAGAHPRPERPRDELRAEADPEQGQTLLDRPLEPAAFAAQVGVASDVIDVHRSAHDYRAGHPARIGQLRAAKDVDHTPLPRGERGCDPVGPLPLDVTQDEHRRSERVHALLPMSSRARVVPC
jgi:hypothetical protein